MKKTKMHFRTSGRMIEHLGPAMYSTSEKAISELVVNGFDAGAENVDIAIGPRTITIKDDGSGMSLKDIDNYCNLGSNSKRAFKSTPKGRLPVGSKGLGRISMFSLAREVHVTTYEKSQRHIFSLDRDKLMGAEVLDKEEFTIETSNGKGAGTVIVLSDLLPHVQGKLDPKKLRTFLARELPRQKGFCITVNKVVCSIADMPAKRIIPVDLRLPLCGHVKGSIIVAKKVLEEPGITLTVRGRAVGAPSFFGLEGYIGGRSNKIAASRLIAGDIEVEGFDPENEDGMPAVILSNREGFRVDHPKYQECRQALAEVLKEIIFDESKNIDKANSSKESKEMDAAMQEAAKMFNAHRGDFPPMFNQQEDRRSSEAGKKMGQPTENRRSPSEDKQVSFEKSETPEEKDKSDKPAKPKDEKEKSAQVNTDPGRIRIGSKSYSFKRRPLGEHSHEVLIDENFNEVVLNSDHPTMSILSKARPASYLIYRMVLDAAVAQKYPTTSEAYDVLDAAVRKQAIPSGE